MTTNETNPDRCTECEEIELARVRDQVPSQAMPMPAAALAGLPEGRESRNLTRRRLLQGGLAGVAAIYGSGMLGMQEIFEAAVAEAATPSSQNCLVMLYLAGGNDSLNTIVPGSASGADRDAYRAARPTIARGIGASSSDLAGSRDIPGTNGLLGWANPVLSSAVGGDNGSSSQGFDVLYGAGNGGPGSDLAFLPSADIVPMSGSHFENADRWFSAGGAQTTGWLGRWIDNNGSATNPLQAVSIDSLLSKAIRTSRNPVSAFTAPDALGYKMSVGGPSGSDIGATMSALGSASSTNAHLEVTRRNYALSVAAAQSTAPVAAQPLTAAAYPTGKLAPKLQLAARILSAGLGTRIITIHWGGFDTHGSQIVQQDPQLIELSRALTAFKADLAARGVEQRVLTMAFSEFGRRVPENGSHGTDHGAGGMMLFSGSMVRGGWAAEYPGCRPQDLVGGNLKITTDCRSAYQAVLSEWLGGDTTGVLPGGPYPALSRHDGGNLLLK